MIYISVDVVLPYFVVTYIFYGLLGAYSFYVAIASSLAAVFLLGLGFYVDIRNRALARS